METGERLEADAALVRHAYQEAIGAAIDGFRARCGALRVDFRIATTDRSPSDFLNELLADRKRLGA